MDVSETTQLIAWDEIKRQIDEARDLQTIVQMQEQIDALKILAKQIDGSLKTQNRCAKYKFYLEQNAGNIYKNLSDEQGKRTDLQKLLSEVTSKQDAEKETGKSGVTLRTWVQESEIEKEIVEKYEAKCNEEEKPFTSKGCVRYAKQKETTKTPEFPKDKYTVIYADPPWKYTEDGLTGVSNKDEYGNVDKFYRQMTIEELCELPISDLAADNAVLFLWVTTPFTYKAKEVFEEWGFSFKAEFVWDKIKHNFGYYNSVRHEKLIIAVRGTCKPQVKKLFDSVQSIERSKIHSEKPEEFRKIIDTLYPEGKRIELFARTKISGWDAWGNEL